MERATKERAGEKEERVYRKKKGDSKDRGRERAEEKEGAEQRKKKMDSSKGRGR